MFLIFKKCPAAVLISAAGKNSHFGCHFLKKFCIFTVKILKSCDEKFLNQEWSIASKLRIFRDCAQHAVRNFPKIKIARNTQYATACRQNHAISRNTQHAIRNCVQPCFASSFLRWSENIDGAQTADRKDDAHFQNIASEYVQQMEEVN